MSDPVAEKVIATLASVKRIPAEKISLDTNLQEMGIDSLDVFSLLFELENAFKISIPDDDVRSIKTVNDIVEGIKKLLAAAPPDTIPPSAHPAPADSASPIPFAVQMPADTVHRRPRPTAIEYPDSYYPPLQIHRDTSYAIYTKTSPERRVTVGVPKPTAVWWNRL